MNAPLTPLTTVLLIGGMTLVTYLPRLLPFTARVIERLPPRLSRLLEYIPPAAVGALVVPGFADAVAGRPAVGAAAVVAAAAAALVTRNMVVHVAAGVLTAWVVGLIA